MYLRVAVLYHRRELTDVIFLWFTRDSFCDPRYSLSAKTSICIQVTTKKMKHPNNLCTIALSLEIGLTFKNMMIVCQSHC